MARLFVALMLTLTFLSEQPAWAIDYDSATIKKQIPIGSGASFVKPNAYNATETIDSATPKFYNDGTISNHQEKYNTLSIIDSLIKGVKWIISKFTREAPVVITYQDIPFGFHTGITFPEHHHLLNPQTAQANLYNFTNPYAYAQDVNVGWERPGIYAHTPKEETNITMDTVYSSVPDSMRIFANIDVRSFTFTEDPKIPKEVRNLTVYTPPVTYLDLINEKEYLQFVKDLVERYDGDGINDMPNLKNPIKYWQIDNELPGIPPGGILSSSTSENDRWFNTSINNYAHILEITCRNIKSSDPQANVAMSGMPDIGPATEGVFYSYYLKVLEKSDSKCVDIFDYHFYGDAKNSWKITKDAYKTIREGLGSIGYKNMEIWITETGTYSGRPRDIHGYAPLQTEKEQAIDLSRRFIYPLTFGVKKVFWAPGIIDFGISEGWDGYMGLIYNGKGPDNPGYGVKKLSYYTYKKMVEVLKGSDWDNIQTIQEKDNIYIYRFTKKDTGKPVWVAWNDNQEERQIVIPNIASTQVKITEAVPKYDLGKNIVDYNNSFEISTKSVHKGEASLMLRNVPLFIEEK